TFVLILQDNVILSPAHGPVLPLHFIFWQDIMGLSNDFLYKSQHLLRSIIPALAGSGGLRLLGSFTIYSLSAVFHYLKPLYQQLTPLSSAKSE
ncbi:MAG: hypothetical protein ACETVZ_04495, partial [Phycisphaerae bacterium]